MSSLDIPVRTQLALGGVFLILLVATALVAVLRRLRPEADFSELSARTRSWWIMFAIFSPVTAASSIVSIV